MLTHSLCTDVQRNCNIADAKYAANYTLCTYLMKMREFCRWDKGYAYSQIMPKEEIGEWVSERESLWEKLEQEEFCPLVIDGKTFDPFATDEINQALLSKGLVYSGGLGARCIPHFFLGELEVAQSHEDYQVIISAQECARDLSAPPAMTLGDTIFIRRESVRRMCWEKVQEWRWHKIENAMSEAIACYDFDRDVEVALQHMTEEELAAIVLHEVGEIKTSKVLGDEWKNLLVEIKSARVELMLRTIKDLFADALVTLPGLLAANKTASIHFHAGNMVAMRRQLCPSFANEYQQWEKLGSVGEAPEPNESLLKWSEHSAAHWQKILRQVLLMYQQEKTSVEIETFIEQSRL